MSISRTSFHGGDIKGMEVTAGLGSDCLVGARFSFQFPVLALPGAAESEVTGHRLGGKNTF